MALLWFRYPTNNTNFFQRIQAHNYLSEEIYIINHLYRASSYILHVFKIPVRHTTRFLFHRAVGRMESYQGPVLQEIFTNIIKSKHAIILSKQEELGDVPLKKSVNILNP